MMDCLRLVPLILPGGVTELMGSPPQGALEWSQGEWG